MTNDQIRKLVEGAQRHVKVPQETPQDPLDERMMDALRWLDSMTEPDEIDASEFFNHEAEGDKTLDEPPGAGDKDR